MNKQVIPIALALFAGLMIIAGCGKDTQPTFSLDGSTKDFVYFRDGSTWQYADLSDSSKTQNYTLTNLVHSDAAKDHSEVLSFDMVASNLPTLTLRAEAGGQAYKDRIAMLTKYNDTVNVGPIVYNINDNFTTTNGDTVTQLATYNNGFRNFTDVVKVRLKQNTLYKYVYFARNAGLIRRELKDGKVYALRNYSVVQ